MMMAFLSANIPLVAAKLREGYGPSPRRIPQVAPNMNQSCTLGNFKRYRANILSHIAIKHTQLWLASTGFRPILSRKLPANGSLEKPVDPIQSLRVY